MNVTKHSVKDWFIATRPWSFPASAMPVLVTLFFLHWLGYGVNWGIGVWALLNIVAFHAAANTWSDYFDYKKGVDREDTIGGMSITSGLFTAGEIRKLSLSLMAVSVLSGLAMLLVTGLPTRYLGLIGCLFIVMYPWLKYHALGDIDIFITYSLLPILGTSYVATGVFYLDVMWLTIPIGLITVGILHINNTRDIEQDRRAGIMTFAMAVGRRMSVLIYWIELFFPFVWVVMCVCKGLFPVCTLLVAPALVPAWGCAVKAFKFPKEGMSAVVGADEQTAKLQLVFSVLLALSFLIASFF